ncbi:unnamed protein product [Effrenium voratum]|nr:unnamed protein product [Effrenium voratum]
MAQLDVYQANLAISASRRDSNWPGALSLLASMRWQLLLPDFVSHNAAVSACQRSQQWRVLSVIARSPCNPNLVTFNTCISACNGSRRWVRALCILELLPVLRWAPDVVSAAGAVHVLREGGAQWERCCQLLRWMPVADIVPNIIAFNSTLSSCERTSHWKGALAILEGLPLKGRLPDVISHSLSVSGCSKARSWKEALFWLVEPRNVLTYNAAIIACEGAWRRVFDMLCHMRMSRNLPDAITFNSALCACAGSWIAAYHLYGLMLREEMLNEVGGNTAISCETARWPASLALAQQMSCRQVRQNVVTIGSVCLALSRGKDWRNVLRLMETSQVRANMVCFNTALTGCSDWLQAWRLLELITLAGCVPNAVSLSTGLGAPGLEWRKALMLAVEDNEMVQNALLAGLATRGWRRALDHLGIMRSNRVAPNLVSFNAALSACEPAGAWLPALGLLRCMRPDPDVISYSSAANTCARAVQPAATVRLLAELQKKKRRRGLTRLLVAEDWPNACALLAGLRGEVVEPDVIHANAAFRRAAWARSWLLLAQLRARNVRRSEVSFAGALKGAQWHNALMFLWHMRSWQSEPNHFCFSSVIRSCSTSTFWQHALLLPRRDVACANAALLGLSWQSSVEMLRGMAAAALQADVATRSTVLRARWDLAGLWLQLPLGEVGHVALLKSALAAGWAKALGLTAQASQLNLSPDIATFKTLIAAVSQTGWSRALALGDFKPELSCDAGPWQRGEVALRDLRCRGLELGLGIPPAPWRRALISAPTPSSPVTLGTALAACQSCQSWRPSVALMEHAATKQVEVNLVCSNSVLDAVDHWPRALQLLQNLSHQADVISYNSVISTCGLWVLLLAMQQKGLQASLTTLNSAARRAPWASSLRLCQGVIADLRADSFTYSSLASCAETASQWLQVMDLLRQMPSRRLRPPLVVANAGISAAEKGLQWMRAQQLLGELSGRAGTVSFNACLSAISRSGLWVQSLHLAQLLHQRSLQETMITRFAVQEACQRAGRWRFCLWSLHSEEDTAVLTMALSGSAGDVSSLEKLRTALGDASCETWLLTQRRGRRRADTNGDLVTCMDEEMERPCGFYRIRRDLPRTGIQGLETRKKRHQLEVDYSLGRVAAPSPDPVNIRSLTCIARIVLEATKETKQVRNFLEMMGVDIDQVDEGHLVGLCNPKHAAQAIRLRSALLQLAELRRILRGLGKAGVDEEDKMRRALLREIQNLRRALSTSHIGDQVTGVEASLTNLRQLLDSFEFSDEVQKYAAKAAVAVADIKGINISHPLMKALASKYGNRHGSMEEATAGQVPLWKRRSSAWKSGGMPQEAEPSFPPDADPGQAKRPSRRRKVSTSQTPGAPVAPKLEVRAKPKARRNSKVKLEKGTPSPHASEAPAPKVSARRRKSDPSPDVKKAAKSSSREAPPVQSAKPATPAARASKLPAGPEAQDQLGPAAAAQPQVPTQPTPSLAPVLARPQPTQARPLKPSPMQPAVAQPAPAQPSAAQPAPAQPALAQPPPAHPAPAQPSTAQPAPAQPALAQPSPAHPKPVQALPVQPVHLAQTVEPVPAPLEHPSQTQPTESAHISTAALALAMHATDSNSPALTLPALTLPTSLSPSLASPGVDALAQESQLKRLTTASTPSEPEPVDAWQPAAKAMPTSPEVQSARLSRKTPEAPRRQLVESPVKDRPATSESRLMRGTPPQKRVNWASLTRVDTKPEVEAGPMAPIVSKVSTDGRRPSLPRRWSDRAPSIPQLEEEAAAEEPAELLEDQVHERVVEEELSQIDAERPPLVLGAARN